MDMDGSSSTLAPARLQLRPLNPHLGAEITGLDLRQPWDEATSEALRTAFRQHRLLLLRKQDVSTADQTRFAEVFGEVSLREKNRVRSTEATAQHVSNVRADGVFGLGELDFHLDQLFHQEPLSALILYAIEVPEEGGDTRFSDSGAALNLMPPALRQRIETLQCRHAYTFDGALASEWNVDDAAKQTLSAVHPMVWRKTPEEHGVLWVNKLTTVGVEGLPEAEGRALMAEVRQYLYDQSIIYTHKWRPGDLLIWDNRRLQHARMPFDPAARRTLRRSPIL
jgi:taurine dioxygenase